MDMKPGRSTLGAHFPSASFCCMEDSAGNCIIKAAEKRQAVHDGRQSKQRRVHGENGRSEREKKKDKV